MSRIGNSPVAVPSGVEINLGADQVSGHAIGSLRRRTERAQNIGRKFENHAGIQMHRRLSYRKDNVTLE